MPVPSEVLEQTFTEDIYNLPGKIIVLIPRPWATISTSERELLGKILSSVKLSLSKIQVISQDKIDLEELSLFKPPVVLSFGCRIKQIDTPFRIVDWNGIRIVEADALNLLNEASKKQLWTALRELFKTN